MRKLLTIIFAIVAGLSLFGLFCEYEGDSMRVFVMYYIACIAVFILSIGAMIFVQSPKEVTELTFAIVIVMWENFCKVCKKVAKWAVYKIQLTVAILGFFHTCRKHHKSFKWTMSQFKELIKN